MLVEDLKYFKDKSLKVEIFEQSGKDIISGKIYSKSESWPIIKGVPRILSKDLLEALVLPEHHEFFKKYGDKFNLKFSKKKSLKINTAQSFQFEWNEYKKIIKIFEKDTYRYFSDFVDLDNLKSDVVADIGCGLAKHGHLISRKAKKYIGVDLSNAVDSAYNNTKQNGSLIVQADIYNNPLDGNLIDLYYSIGVLHHLPNPYKGFKSIVNLMKKKSKILIWVYGRENNGRAIYFYNPLRLITTKMNKRLLYGLCHIPAVLVHVLNGLTLFLNKLGLNGDKLPFSYYANFPYDFKVNDSFDIFATPKQEYYYKKDIVKWFKNAGLNNYKLLDDKYQGIKAFGVK